MNLAAMVLLKDNHVAAAGGVGAAIAAVRSAMAQPTSVAVEVEVQSFDEACQALRAGAEWIMLDNMSIPRLRAVVRSPTLGHNT